MRKIFIAIFSFLMISSYSQERRVITTAVPFLMIASDARAAGMGEQGVATSVDNFSQHWNPAKYAFINNDIGHLRVNLKAANSEAVYCLRG